MNKIYKLVWNETLQSWVTVSELTPSRGKKAKIIGSLSLISTLLMAIPTHAASIGLRIDNGASNPTNLLTTYNGRNVVPIFDDYSMRGIQVQNNSRLSFSNASVNVDMTQGAVASRPMYPVGVYLNGSAGTISNVANFNNAKITVKGPLGAIGIDDNDKNTVNLYNTTFNVIGNKGRTVGYDQYTYYECSTSAPCQNRYATAKGTTIMNVSNTNNDTAAGWMSSATSGKRAILNITGNSITNIRSTGLSKPYGYFVSSNGNLLFNNAVISGTTNGKSDVYIRAGGNVHFIGTSKATSPLHILTKYGNVYFNKISGPSFMVDELRSLQGNTTSTGYDYGENGSDGGVYNSNVYLGDKSLYISGKHSTPNDRNYFTSSLHGSNKSRLTKSGTNTLSFNGNNNNFLGDLIIVQGTFQLMSGSMANTRLATVKTGATLAGNGNSSGTTGVIGKTIIDSGGTLQVGSTVNTNASRQFFGINGYLINNGTVRIHNSKGIVGNNLLVKGNYVGGSGSKLYMAFAQTKTNPNNIYESPKVTKDTMVVNGNTSGTSTVYVSNLGNVGVNYANSNGILLIDVKGVSNGKFVQGGRIVAGAYDYYLVRGNPAYGSADSNKDWYLNNRKPTTTATAAATTTSATPTLAATALSNAPLTTSPTETSPEPISHTATLDPKIIRPEAASYNSTAIAANNMFNLSLQERLNAYAPMEYETEGGGVDGRSNRGSAWVHYSGSSANFKDGSGQLDSNVDKNTIMLGADIVAYSNNDQNKITVGLMGGYGRAQGSSHNNLSNHNSRHETDGYGIGLYGSYQQNANEQSGLYADSWIMWNDFDHEVSGDGLPKAKYDSKGVTAALELGYNWNVAEKNNVRYVLQPHAQLRYQNVQADDFTEKNGTKVRFDDGSGLKTTIGMRAAAHIQTSAQTAITPYAEINYVHNSKDYGVYMNDIASDLQHQGGAVELKLGLQGDIARNLSLNAEASYLGGRNDYKELGGSIGVKYRF